MKASEFGKSHSFDLSVSLLTLDVHIYGTNHLSSKHVYFEPEKKTLTHFSRKSCSLPPLVEHVHQWLTMDLIHFCKAVQENFLAAAITLLSVFFKKCQTSN